MIINDQSYGEVDMIRKLNANTFVNYTLSKHQGTETNLSEDMSVCECKLIFYAF
jgi:hypothetical protein